MPKKTIYIRDEDQAIFDEAMRKLGGEAGMGAVIADALRKSLTDYTKIEEEALRLAMLSECPLPGVLGECVEFRLHALPPEIVTKARLGAQLAYAEDPEHFIHADYVALDSTEWWEKAKDMAERGKQRMRESLAEAWKRAAERLRREGFQLPETPAPIRDVIKNERFLEALLRELSRSDEEVES